MAQLVIFDMGGTWATSPRHFATRGGADPAGRGDSDGAVRMDGQRIADTFRVTMRPRIFPKLYHHVAKVTGLTQADLAAGRR